MSPTLLTDDSADHLADHTAAQARTAAVIGSITWHGKPLLWTSSRAALYDYLRIPSPMLSAAAIAAIKAAREAEGTPAQAALQDQANEIYMAETGGSTGHVRNAQIILWLAAHVPGDWRALVHDRGRLLESIDAWTDENVGIDELQKLADVTNELLTAADATRAIARPRHVNADESGN